MLLSTIRHHNMIVELKRITMINELHQVHQLLSDDLVLIHAIEKGQMDIVFALLESGYDVNVSDYVTGRTALMYAFDNLHKTHHMTQQQHGSTELSSEQDVFEEIVDVLLDRGADVTTIKDSEGFTVETYVREHIKCETCQHKLRHRIKE